MKPRNMNVVVGGKLVGGGTGAGARTFFTLTNLIEVYVAR